MGKAALSIIWFFIFLKQMFRALRWLGCLCLVGLEFLASLHLHGAVDNPVWSQRLQPHHFHDHHLENTKNTSVKFADENDSSFETGHRATRRQWMWRWQILQFDINVRNTLPATITIYTFCHCPDINNMSILAAFLLEQPIRIMAVLSVETSLNAQSACGHTLTRL